MYIDFAMQIGLVANLGDSTTTVHSWYCSLVDTQECGSRSLRLQPVCGFCREQEKGVYLCNLYDTFADVKIVEYILLRDGKSSTQINQEHLLVRTYLLDLSRLCRNFACCCTYFKIAKATNNIEYFGKIISQQFEASMCTPHCSFNKRFDIGMTQHYRFYSRQWDDITSNHTPLAIPASD